MKMPADLRASARGQGGGLGGEFLGVVLPEVAVAQGVEGFDGLTGLALAYGEQGDRGRSRCRPAAPTGGGDAGEDGGVALGERGIVDGGRTQILHLTLYCGSHKGRCGPDRIVRIVPAPASRGTRWTGPERVINWRSPTILSRGEL